MRHLSYYIYNRVYLNGYGNFVSCGNLESSPIDLEALAEWLEETQADVFLYWQNGGDV